MNPGRPIWIYCRAGGKIMTPPVLLSPDKFRVPCSKLEIQNWEPGTLNYFDSDR
jgi:hypothetical protein